MFAKDGHFNLRNELPARLSEGNRCNLCTDTFIKYSYSKTTIRSIFFSIAGRHDLCLCHRSAKLQVVKQKRVTFDIDRTTMTLACALCCGQILCLGCCQCSTVLAENKEKAKGLPDKFSVVFEGFDGVENCKQTQISNVKVDTSTLLPLMFLWFWLNGAIFAFGNVGILRL